MQLWLPFIDCACEVREEAPTIDSFAQYIKLHPARVFALVLCISVLLGGSLPELGNLANYYLLHSRFASHYFNKLFLVLGVLGLIVSYIALRRG